MLLRMRARRISYSASISATRSGFSMSHSDSPFDQVKGEPCSKASFSSALAASRRPRDAALSRRTHSIFCWKKQKVQPLRERHS